MWQRVHTGYWVVSPKFDTHPCVNWQASFWSSSGFFLTVAGYLQVLSQFQILYHPWKHLPGLKVCRRWICSCTSCGQRPGINWNMVECGKEDWMRVKIMESKCTMMGENPTFFSTPYKTVALWLCRTIQGPQKGLKMSMYCIRKLGGSGGTINKQG